MKDQTEQHQPTIMELEAALIPKRRQFAHEYLIDFNATQAALRAGYSKKGARTEGCRLLTDANTVQLIEALRTNVEYATGITKARVLNELSKIAFGDFTDIYTDWGQVRPWGELTKDQRALLADIDVTRRIELQDGKATIERVSIKRESKINALKEIARLMGYYAPTKVEADVKATVSGSLTLEDYSREDD